MRCYYQRDTSVILVCFGKKETNACQAIAEEELVERFELELSKELPHLELWSKHEQCIYYRGLPQRYCH